MKGDNIKKILPLSNDGENEDGSEGATNYEISIRHNRQGRD